MTGQKPPTFRDALKKMESLDTAEEKQATLILSPQYLERFLLQGPEGYGSYCSELLSRIKVNGERKEPPCWIELQVETLSHVFLIASREAKPSVFIAVL